MPELSIVIPLYNEAPFLDAALDEVATLLAGRDAELLLVENGSSDNTLSLAKSALDRLDIAGHVLSLPDPDYGTAIREGLIVAEGDWLVLFDIDFFSGEFLAAVEATDRADILIGSKRAPGAMDERSPFRRWATGAFNLVLRVLTGSPFTDTHGIKAFRREVVEALVSQVASRADLFDTELILRAHLEGYVIEEVPVAVQERRPARSSLLKRVPRTIVGMLQLRSALNASRKTRSR